MSRGTLLRMTVTFALALSGPARVGAEGMALSEVSERLGAVQTDYFERNTPAYRFGVQELLEDAKAASPVEIHERLRRIVEHGSRRGFDGFEPLIAAYADALAKDASGVDPVALSSTQDRLEATLHYREPAAANLRMPIGRVDSPVIRSVRSEAVRTVVDGLVDRVGRIGDVQLDDALANPDLQDDLCALALRFDDLGDVAEKERSREARCEALRDPALPQPNTGLLDDFSDLTCLAEGTGTPAVGELEAILEECLADSAGDGAPSARDGSGWLDQLIGDYYRNREKNRDLNGDGVWGSPERHAAGDYPYQRFQREAKVCGLPCKKEPGAGTYEASVYAADAAARTADEAVIAAWEAASEAAIDAVTAWNEAVIAAEEAFAAAVNGSGTIEEATAAQERADELRKKADAALAEEEKARHAMEERLGQMPPDERSVNLDSEACQDLISLISAGRFDYEGLTGTIRPPAYEQPSPEDESQGDASPECGLSNDGVPSDGGGCEQKVLCPEGFSLNESCGCDENPLSEADMARVAGFCPFQFVCDGQVVVEKGICSCVSEQDVVEPDDGPPPVPDPATDTTTTSSTIEATDSVEPVEAEEPSSTDLRSVLLGTYSGFLR